MSFSNADTGSKPADPYVAKNIQDPDLKEKVEDLANYVDSEYMSSRGVGIFAAAQRLFGAVAGLPSWHACCAALCKLLDSAQADFLAELPS